MAGELLTLPLRIGVRGTRMFWRKAEGITERAVIGVLQVARMLTHGESTQTAAPAVKDEPAGPAQPRREPGAPSRPRGSAAPVSSPTTTRPAPPTTRPAPPTTRPVPPASQPAPPAGGPAPIVSAPLPAQEPPPPIAPEPVHVSEEPELVREVAEPGAEEGAGASVRIDPPWEGYRRMGARDVIARLEGANAAELAAVQLYESANRSRQTVLVAVERRLKAANGRG